MKKEIKTVIYADELRMEACRFEGSVQSFPGHFHEHYVIGFTVAMAGVALIGFNGSRMELNPAGDVLAVLAAFVWACYSILTRKISSFGYPVILTLSEYRGKGKRKQ